eukprot:tig00001041_g6577.t1
MSQQIERKHARTDAAAGSSTEAGSVSAAGPSAAATVEAEAGGSGEVHTSQINHFERLPDELVQRIFSELEAFEAYEKCRLWAVDRRFRRLSAGVHWQQLEVVPAAGQGDDLLEIMKDYKRRLCRVAARVHNGTLAGCRRLHVAPASAFTFPSGAIAAANMATELLAALSMAPVPLEHVRFSGQEWSEWPSDAEQRELGIDEPQSLESIARACQTALQPARVQSVRLGEYSFTKAFFSAAVPGCLPHVRELDLPVAELETELTVKLALACPGVKKLSCNLCDAAALQELARLPLEELRASLDSAVGLESALKALNADSVRALRLPWDTAEDDLDEPIEPSVFAAILSLRHLEELTGWVGLGSADTLARLASLQKLRRLALRLDVSGYSTPGDAARLLQAAVSAVEAAPRLESISLWVVSSGHQLLDSAGLALESLIRASRPHLEFLKIRGGPPSPGLMREVARAGPKLERLILRHKLTDQDGIDKLGAFSELASMSAERRAGDNSSSSLDVRVPNPLREQAASILRGWLTGRTRLDSVTVNYNCFLL